MATENWHIERVADTLANIRSNMDAYQSGICTDDALTGIRHVCANATPDYIYGAAMARKTAVAGGAVTYLPEQFGALTAASLKIEDLTASQPVYTDANKVLVSMTNAALGALHHHDDLWDSNLGAQKLTLDAIGRATLAIEDGTNGAITDFLALTRTFSGEVTATTNDGVGISGTLECACGTYEIGRINFWKEGSIGTAEASMSFFTGYGYGAAREAMRIDSAKKLWAYGDATITGNIKQSYYTNLQTDPGSISNGGTGTIDIQSSLASECFDIEVLCVCRVSNNIKMNSLRYAGSVCLSGNALADNNFALIIKDGGENITMALTAVGSNNQIRITITNNAGDTINHIRILVKILTTDGSTWTLV